MLLQIPAASTALIVVAFQILFPLLGILRHGFRLPHAQLQWGLPIGIAALCYGTNIGLALSTQGSTILSSCLPISFRWPLVLACVLSSLALCELVTRLVFLLTHHSAVCPSPRV